MLERWNPTVKAFTVLVCVILLSFEYLVSLNLMVLAVCLLLLVFCSRVSLKKIGVILLPACIAAFGLFVMGLYYARGGSTQTVDMSSLSAMPYSVRAAMSQNLYTALQLATRLLAYAGLGILFALSTEGDFFIASLLHQCRLPPKFAYGILAAFHLMPGMAREYAQVRTAFAVRGLKMGPLSMKPVFTMLVNSAGMNILNNMIDGLEKAHQHLLKGLDVFKLNDTFGFPLDLTKDILEEKGITVDEDKFNALLAAQKATARAARKDAGADAWKGNSVKINASATDFVGYTDFACDAKVLAIVNADGELVDMLGAGDSGTLVLDKTPFYAQSGGQVGDSGVIKNGADNAFIVADTVKNADKIFLHRGEVTRGIVSVGDTVQAEINAERRRSIMRNHTAAHLLQAALRQVLGTHVEQAGQLVDEREVRFDFTHFNAMTRDELLKVEHLVNAFIMGAHPVESMEMPIDEAKKLGAMMLFGEKYGNIVRVVKAGDFSTEFCGGTHVSNSGQIGLFHIVSEASVASGVRRITALTGSNVLAHIYQADGMLSGAAAMLRSAVHDLPEKLAALADSDKAKDKEIKSLKEELAHLKSADLFAAPVDLDGLAFYTATLTDVAPDALRSMGDELKNKGDNVVAVVAGVNGEKANIVAVCGKEAIARGVKAGDVVREIAKLAGGGGGGRPDSAMAGCKNVDKLPDAMAQAAALVQDMIQ